MAPVDLETARKMIAEVRGLQPLTGYRGAEKGDLKALADAIVALSSLAIRPDLKSSKQKSTLCSSSRKGRVRSRWMRS
jgi:hypothetical protein